LPCGGERVPLIRGFFPLLWYSFVDEFFLYILLPLSVFLLLSLERYKPALFPNRCRKSVVPHSFFFQPPFSSTSPLRKHRRNPPGSFSKSLFLTLVTPLPNKNLDLLSPPVPPNLTTYPIGFAWIVFLPPFCIVSLHPPPNGALPSPLFSSHEIIFFLHFFCFSRVPFFFKIIVCLFFLGEVFFPLPKPPFFIFFLIFYQTADPHFIFFPPSFPFSGCVRVVSSGTPPFFPFTLSRCQGPNFSLLRFYVSH